MLRRDGRPSHEFHNVGQRLTPKYSYPYALGIFDFSVRLYVDKLRLVMFFHGFPNLIPDVVVPSSRKPSTDHVLTNSSTCFGLADICVSRSDT